MRFAQKTLKCLNCKTALPSDRTTLCIHCESKEAEIYGKSMLQVCMHGSLLVGLFQNFPSYPVKTSVPSTCQFFYGAVMLCVV